MVAGGPISVSELLLIGQTNRQRSEAGHSIQDWKILNASSIAKRRCGSAHSYSGLNTLAHGLFRPPNRFQAFSILIAPPTFKVSSRYGLSARCVACALYFTGRQGHCFGAICSLAAGSLPPVQTQMIVWSS